MAQAGPGSKRSVDLVDPRLQVSAAAVLIPEVLRQLYDLEANVAGLQCTLLDALTPNQFALVLPLRDAVETLTATEMAASEARRSASRGTSRPSRRDRDAAALHWLRARRAKPVA
jgi:hypothetical protein